MIRRPKPVFISGMLVLYTGMMLFGQCLHDLLGCEHDHGSVAGRSRSVARAPDRVVAHAERAVEQDHDADACPICQFQAQGQLASAVVGSELKQPLVATAPQSSSPIVAVFALGIQGPRPPPRV